MRPQAPMMPQNNLPANASPEMKEFMANRMTLMQKMAELRSQNPSSNPNGPPDPKMIAQFQQQNADLLKRQRELAQIIGQQQAKYPIPTPPPLQIPPNASPQLQTPKFFELAEVVGKWVWIEFTEQQPAAITRLLAELGFHWNNTRQAWQHPCGTIQQERAAFDPRKRYRRYFAADAKPV